MIADYDQPLALELDHTSTDQTVHVLMPIMLFACGASMLDTAGRYQVGVVDWAHVTCVGCRALGEGAVRAAIRAQQSPAALPLDQAEDKR